MTQVFPVAFVGAGPGDPELLTLHALRAIESADVILHDALVTDAVLAWGRPHATLLPVGKRGFGRSVRQVDINAAIVAHAQSGARVVRLKGGDPAVFARLDEEIAALEAADLPYTIVPGITAASAAAAAIGQPLTRRGAGRELRIVTGHDMQGFADQDWRALARDGAVTAIYMGRRAARFVQGRLMMHGADPALPVTVVVNATRPDEAQVTGTLGTLPDTMARAPEGPAMLLLSLAPRTARAVPMPQQEAL